MKKIFFLSMLLSLTQFSIAQEAASTDGRVFKKFKTDVSLGYAIPKGEQSDGGVLFAIEPKYAITDQINVGLRIEVAVTANIDEVGDQSKATGNGSYLLTGDYYFTTNKFRPFAGLGGGFYTTATVDANTELTSSGDLPTDSNFGFMARAGFEYGHLRMGFEYNFLKENAGYLGLKLGVVIGGGRK
jgi:outer membrane protein W